MLGHKKYDLDKMCRVMDDDDCPVSLGVHLHEDGKEGLMMMFISPKYEKEATEFAQSLIDAHKKRKS